LFGHESENLEKQLVKIQAVMALTQGISEVGELGKNFTLAMTSAKAFYAQLVSGEIATKAVAVATRVWNAVLSVNPIFILVAIITAVIGAMAMLAAKESEETEILKANIAEREKAIQKMDEEIKKMEKDAKFRESLAKAEGKSEAEILQMRKRNIDEAMKKREEENEALVETIHEKERILEDADEEEKKEIEKQIKELNDKRKENYAKQIDDYNALRIDLAAERTKQLEEEKKAEEDRNKAAKEAAKKRAEELLAAEKELKDKLKALRLENITDEREKILAQYEEERVAIANNISTNAKLKADLQKELEIKYQRELDEYQKEQDEKAAQKEKERIEKVKADTDKAVAEAAEKRERLKAIKEQEAQDDETIRQAKLDIAQSTADGLGALGNLFINDQKKLEKFNKANALVQIGIDSAKAISNTIASATQAAAAGGPAAPFLAATYIASGIATVLTNMAKAKALLGASGSSGGGASGGGGGGTANAPRRND